MPPVAEFTPTMEPIFLSEPVQVFVSEPAPEVETFAAAVEPAASEPAEAEPIFSLDSLPPEEQELHRRAYRVAKVSMQDIKMLRPEDVRVGRENKDLCIRLRDDIEKAHKEYDRRFQSIQSHPVDYFYDWMVEILGGGDAQALGEYPYPSPSCTGSVNTAAGKTACSRTLVRCAALAVFLLIAACPGLHAQTVKKPAKKPAAKTAAKAPRKPAAPVAAAAADAGEKRLAQLSRALRDNGNATTYAALSAFANQNAKNDLGARAALALGYYDLSRDKPELALAWLRKAVGDKLLREYVQYWQAQTSLALGQKKEGIEQLWSFRRDFPASVMTEQAVTSLAQAALSEGKGDEALSALEAYPDTNAKPALLLLRAQANEKIAAAKGEKPVAAAAEYLDLYYRFPLNDEAKAAGQRIPSLQFALGEAFPGTPLQTQIARAEAFFLAKRWSEARTEYAGLLPKLSGRDHERAELRIALCEVQLGRQDGDR